MRGFAIAFFCLAIPLMAIGEPRWCSVSSRDTSNTIVYVPIAAAAQVQGEARARIIYSPNSRVERVEPVSGVPMLLEPLAGQLSNWTVRSNASGHELCQTLVIATFMLRKPSRSWTRKQKVKFTTGPNAIHVLISRPRPEIETDTSSPALKGS